MRGWAILLVGAPACTVLTDLDVLRGAGLDASIADGSSDADVGVVDGSRPPDSSARFCESLKPSATFCDDFDDVFGALWGMQTTTGPGAMVGPSSISASPPKSFRAIVGGPTTSGMAASLTKSFGGPRGTLQCDFDIQPIKKPTTAYMEVITFGVAIGNDDYYVGIVMGPDDQWFAEHDSPNMPAQYDPHVLSKPIPTGVFTHVAWRLELDAAKGGPTVTLTIGGNVERSGMLPAFGFAKGAPFVVAGIPYAPKTLDGGEVLIDNVVVRIE